MTDDSAPQEGAPESVEPTAERPASDAADAPGEVPAAEAPAAESPASETPTAEPTAATTPVTEAPAAAATVTAPPAAAARAADQRTPDAATGPEAQPGRPNRRKVREGLVISIAMDKTAVVGVIDRVRHPRYAKTVQRTKRLYAHDENNDLRVGDRVRLAESRPMSKLKRWRVIDVLERAK
jgi:small subunit ribosomal protein S17